jgi:hypothetical protein
MDRMFSRFRHSCNFADWLPGGKRSVAFKGRWPQTPHTSQHRQCDALQGNRHPALTQPWRRAWA